MKRYKVSFEIGRYDIFDDLILNEPHVVEIEAVSFKDAREKARNLYAYKIKNIKVVEITQGERGWK